MLSSNDANNFEHHIEQLMQCKPLKENEVKLMCDKVTQIF